MSVLEQKRGNKIFFGSDNDALAKLIILNVIITAGLFFIRFIYQFSGIPLAEYKAQVVDWFTLPADLGKSLTRPWTFVTFMFTHIEIWGLIANMLWLWAFGYILQDLAGNRKVAPIYLYGGIAGAVVFLLCSNLVPPFAAKASQMSFIGANASVMALAVGATLLSPGYRIFPMINGGIPLWILTLIYFLLNFAGIATGYAPIYLAHLAGAGMGFLYVNRLQKGKDWGEWMHTAYDWFFNLFTPDKPTRAKSLKKDVFYNTRGKQPFKKTPNLTQDKVDELLEKIKRLGGFRYLSEEEQDFLRRAADEDL